MSDSTHRSTVSIIGAIALVGVVLAVVIVGSVSSPGTPSENDVGGANTAREDNPDNEDTTGDQDMGGWGQYTTEERRIVVNADQAIKVEGDFQKGVWPAGEGEGDDAEKVDKVSYVGAPDGACGKNDDPSDHAAVFEFEVKEAGRYYPWARVWWKDSCGDSLMIILESDDGRKQEFPVTDGVYQSWHWLQMAGAGGLPLEKGTYMLRVENREDGARLDKILFIDADYENYTPTTPQG